jgi:hypothetical protein
MTIWVDTGAALRLEDELTTLHSAIDQAMGVLYQGLSGGAKQAALEDVLRMGRKFEALQAQVLTSFETTAEHRHEGHGSVVSWAKTHTHAHGRDVARLRRLAHWLRDLPLAAGAHRAGLIGAEHIEVLHRAYRLLGPKRYRLMEELLVDAAVEERFVDFEQSVDYVVVRAAPDDADKRKQREIEERYASSSKFGDHGKVDAQFDDVAFAIWQAELERQMDHLLEGDRAEARDRLGRAPLHGELRRTTRQRRADAMVEMARRSALYDGRDLGPSPFAVNVHVDPAFLTALIAVLAKAMNSEEHPAFDLDEALSEIELTEDSMHELDDGTVITVNTVVFALLTGTIRGILYDPNGEVLRFGRARRLYSPAQRSLGQALYRRCAHLWGCDRTGPATQSDHRHEHQDGGLTDVANLDRYCGPHNVWKTNHRFDPPPEGAPPPDTAQRRTPRQPGRRRGQEQPDAAAA